MLAIPDIREQMLAMCNLVTQPRYETLLSQSCALLSDALECPISVLFLLDGTGKNFLTGAGHWTGNTHWVAPALTVPLNVSQSAGCPLSQVAMTGKGLCVVKGAGGYDLSQVSPVLDEVPTGQSVCFLPLNLPGGNLAGIYVLSGDELNQSRLSRLELQLTLRAIGSLLAMRRKEKIEAQHRGVLEKYLARADRDRGLLRQRTESRLEERLPGGSEFMRSLRARLISLADFNDPILIEGETGLAKETFARALHKVSKRSASPFVYVNCCTLNVDTFAPELFGHKRGAIQGVAGARKGLLREAGEGMVYFDQVDALNSVTQGLLLRLLETRRYRPLGSEREAIAGQRMVFATAKPLGDSLALSEFAPSLYHKISQAKLSVSPLRERREDIADLAVLATEKEAKARKQHFRLDPEAITYLMGLELTGNTLELEAIVQRACHQAGPDGVLGVGSFAEDETHEIDAAQDIGLKRSVENFEAAIIRKTLETQQNNRARAAEVLGVPKRTLADKCLKYGL